VQWTGSARHDGAAEFDDGDPSAAQRAPSDLPTARIASERDDRRFGPTRGKLASALVFVGQGVAQPAFDRVLGVPQSAIDPPMHRLRRNAASLGDRTHHDVPGHVEERTDLLALGVAHFALSQGLSCGFVATLREHASVDADAPQRCTEVRGLDRESSG
jgi:hypothetical protein